MSEQITLPISALEELRCFQCKGYLSCSPVRLLPNGHYICGRCSPLDTDTPIHRLAALEIFLSKMSFPCVFKKYGCSSKLLFGKTADHESKCVHAHVVCPITTNCSWEGITAQLLHHFKDIHPDYLKDKAEFNLEVDKDAQGVFMTTESSLPFIVKYFYNTKERILKYAVKVCANINEFDVLFKMQLISGTNPNDNCNINLNMSECSADDKNFCGMQNAQVVNLYKFLEILSEPDCIVVALLQFIKSNDNDNVTTANECEVNFELVKTLKCSSCQNNLLPPLFDLDGNTLCCDCGKKNSKCKLSNDQDLMKIVNDAVYPCRWRECKFKGKSDIFQDHVTNCQFRLYCCVYNNCYITFKVPAAVDHLQTHNKARPIVCMSENITYKTSFAQKYGSKDIVLIKNNRFICIAHKMTNPSPSYVHQINVYRSPGDSFNIIGIVDFEHEHCTVKSKEFNVMLSNDLKVTLKELPPCFKETDELTVTVQLITIQQL